jgi:hypothetical protein
MVLAREKSIPGGSDYPKGKEHRFFLRERPVEGVTKQL